MKIICFLLVGILQILSCKTSAVQEQSPPQPQAIESSLATQASFQQALTSNGREFHASLASQLDQAGVELYSQLEKFYQGAQRCESPSSVSSSLYQGIRELLKQGPLAFNESLRQWFLPFSAQSLGPTNQNSESLGLTGERKITVTVINFYPAKITAKENFMSRFAVGVENFVNSRSKGHAALAFRDESGKNIFYVSYPAQDKLELDELAYNRDHDKKEFSFEISGYTFDQFMVWYSAQLFSFHDTALQRLYLARSSILTAIKARFSLSEGQTDLLRKYLEETVRNPGDSLLTELDANARVIPRNLPRVLHDQLDNARLEFLIAKMNENIIIATEIYDLKKKITPLSLEAKNLLIAQQQEMVSAIKKLADIPPSIEITSQLTRGVNNQALRREILQNLWLKSAQTSQVRPEVDSLQYLAFKSQVQAYWDAAGRLEARTTSYSKVYSRSGGGDLNNCADVVTKSLRRLIQDDSFYPRGLIPRSPRELLDSIEANRNNTNHFGPGTTAGIATLLTISAVGGITAASLAASGSLGLVGLLPSASQCLIKVENSFSTTAQDIMVTMQGLADLQEAYYRLVRAHAA